MVTMQRRVQAGDMAQSHAERIVAQVAYINRLGSCETQADHAEQ